MPLIMIGGAKGSDAPPPGNHFFATYLGTAASDTDSAANYTLNVDFGDYDPDRQIIVVAMWGNSANPGVATMPASITIGDDSAPVLDGVSWCNSPGFPTATPRAYCAVWRGVPTDVGTSPIVLTPASTNWQYVSVYVFSTTDPVVPYQSQAGCAYSPTPARVLLGVPQGGFVIGGCSRTSLSYGGSLTWGGGIITDAIAHGNIGSLYLETAAGHCNNQAEQDLDVTSEMFSNQGICVVSYGAASDTPTVDWIPVWWNSNVYNVSGISENYSGYTIRGRLPAALLQNVPASADKIRLTIQTGDTEGFTFDKMYVGHGATSGDAWDAADLTEVTFGGSSGCAIGVGEQIISDAVNWSYDGTSDIIVTFHCSGDTSHDRIQTTNGVTGAVTRGKSGVDEAADTNPASSYFSGSFSTNSVPLICKIDMGQSAP